MKKKLISVLALVLVVCFVWVAEVDAASVITFDTQQEIELFFAGVKASADGSNVFTFDALYNNDLFSLVGLVPNYTYPQIIGCNTGCVSGDRLEFSLFVLFPYNSVSISSITVYNYPFNTHSNYSYTLNPVQVELSFDEFTLVCNGYRIDISMVVSNPMISISITSGSFDKVVYGMLCPLVTYGLTDEDKSILEQILLGVNNNESQLETVQNQLEQIESEQSSYYEEMITPDESNLNAAESMSEALESGKEIVDEYSSLNDALEKPTADQLLPDYDRVVDGYVDTSIFDVFSTLYESGYIMFILLITCFFGVMSYALFGKKA